MAGRAGVERMLTELLEASHLAALEDLPGMTGRCAAEAGLHEVLIFIVNLRQDALCLLVDERDPAADRTPLKELRVDSTLGGRAFQEVRILAQDGPDGTRHWWVPLLDGTERLGVLRVTTDPLPQPPEALRHLASLIALLLVSQRAHSDLYPRLVRSRPMNVAAEMQWRLIPPLTFATPRVTVSGAMEPAYEVGGDTFDYALHGDTLHLALFDAMGHNVSAGLMANLAMAACRNHRRQGMGLAANSEAIERVLIAEFGNDSRFVTAVMADLDLRTGLLSWINRGHPLPVLIRGGRWSTSLSCPPAHPMGLGLGLPVTLCHEQLEPGDRLLFYTDGIIEAGAPEGREFGLDRFVDFIIRHNSTKLPVPETLRRLMANVIAHHQGRLHDDATVLFTEWHGD